MKRKHPLWKKAVTSLTEAELQIEGKDISRKHLNTRLQDLKHDVSPGLGYMRNEYLLTLLLNPEHQMTPNVASAVENLFYYANAIVKV